MIPEVTPQAFIEERAGANRPILVDVRERHELQIAALDHDINIPLGELPDRLDELDPEADYVIVCRSGGRSGKATEYLLQHGFKHVRNLVGGTLRWGREIDPSVQAY